MGITIESDSEDGRAEGRRIVGCRFRCARFIANPYAAVGLRKYCFFQAAGFPSAGIVACGQNLSAGEDRDCPVQADIPEYLYDARNQDGSARAGRIRSWG